MLQASAGEGSGGPASLDRVPTIPTLTERVCFVAGEEGNSLTIRILLLYLPSFKLSPPESIIPKGEMEKIFSNGLIIAGM